MCTPMSRFPFLRTFRQPVGGTGAFQINRELFVPGCWLLRTGWKGFDMNRHIVDDRGSFPAEASLTVCDELMSTATVSAPSTSMCMFEPNFVPHLNGRSTSRRPSHIDCCKAIERANPTMSSFGAASSTRPAQAATPQAIECYDDRGKHGRPMSARSDTPQRDTGVAWKGRAAEYCVAAVMPTHRPSPRRSRPLRQCAPRFERALLDEHDTSSTSNVYGAGACRGVWISCNRADNNQQRRSQQHTDTAAAAMVSAFPCPYGCSLSAGFSLRQPPPDDD